MGIHYTTELRCGSTFEEPSDQGWTFGTRDVIDAAQRSLLIESDMDPLEVSKLQDDDLAKAVADRLELEFPRYNNDSPLGRYVISTYPSISLSEGEGQRLGGEAFVVPLGKLTRLHWAIRTLGLNATAPDWLLMSVAD